MSLLRKTTDSILQSLNIPSLNNVSGASLCAWFRLNSIPPVGADPTDKYCVLSISIGPAPGALTNSSRLECEIENDPGPLPKINIAARSLDSDFLPGVASTSSGIVIAGTTYHVAITADYVNQVISIYLNGALVITTNTTGFTAGNTSATNSISGGIGNEDSGTPEQLDGYLEDERIYSRILTPDEVRTIYECQGIDGIVQNLEQRYELQDNAAGVLLSNSTPDDSARQALNAFVQSGTPVYAESIAPTYRRRLP